MVPLVVILGAGASRGSGFFQDNVPSPWVPEVPPLTVDLFNEQKYGPILREYDLAHQAGRFIEQERAQDDALGLETVLHRLGSSEYQHHRHMALAVPLYLQHLLFAVSEGLYSGALHYDRLIERLLCLPYVYFVSLNYDLMIDRRLNAYRPLETLADYISDDKNWALIKPHGSVNWYHTAEEGFIPSKPPSNLGWSSGTFECTPPDASLEAIRGWTLTSPYTDRYPALAAPEGPDDRLVLPQAHQKFFFANLRQAQQIDLLVIGYSALDSEVLRLIRETRAKVRHITVVNQDRAMAAAVLERITKVGFNPVWNEVIDTDFASWSSDGGLTRLVEEYGGPYPRAA